MGNTINLAITLDHETNAAPELRTRVAATAGQPLRGQVVVKVKNRMAGSELKLWVIGVEKVIKSHRTRAFDLDSEGRSIQRVIMRTSTVVRDLRGQSVLGGEYRFPFSIELPSSLPSSMTWRDHRQSPSSVISIEYKLIAQLGRRRKDSVERYTRLVAAPFDNVAVPCFLEPMTRNIKALGFRSIGSVTFGASVQDTHVGRGQEVSLSLACRNDASVDIENVEIKLVELISYNHDFRTRHYKNTLLEQSNISLLGTQKATNTTIAAQSQEEKFRDIYQRLLQGENVIHIQIPETARDSFAGNIIKIQHYLKVKLLTQAFVDNVTLKIPLQIGRAPIVEQQQEEAVPVAHLPPLDDYSTSEEPDVVVLPSAPPEPAAAYIYNNDDEQAEIDDGKDYPIAPATLLPTAPTEADVIFIPASQVRLGGATSQRNEDSAIPLVQQYQQQEDDTNNNNGNASASPSLAALLEEMLMSLNDHDMLSEKISIPSWRTFLSQLTPQDFGSIIAHVNNDFDQPRVGKLVGSTIASFTCLHCAEAVKNCADWNRASMVSALVQLCNDLVANQQVILNVLTPWEQTVTQADLNRALQQATH